MTGQSDKTSKREESLHRGFKTQAAETCRQEYTTPSQNIFRRFCPASFPRTTSLAVRDSGSRSTCKPGEVLRCSAGSLAEAVAVASLDVPAGGGMMGTTASSSSNIVWDVFGGGVLSPLLSAATLLEEGPLPTCRGKMQNQGITHHRGEG